MAKPGDATCARCGGRRTVPGYVRDRPPPEPRQPSIGRIRHLWFQFTFPRTLLARFFDQGNRLAIDHEFDLCLDCGLLWATVDASGVEEQVRKSTGALAFGKPDPLEGPGVRDVELDGPI